MVRLTKKLSRELWSKLPWKKFRRNLFRLQHRLYKAIRAGNPGKARKIQKLILKSTSAKMLAIRQITQLNKGKKTAGIDGKKSLDFEQRLSVFFSLNNLKYWTPKKLRRISIPKKNGKTRILSVPTIKDRIWQCLIKYALEPAHEATFSGDSYGFRPGRSAHDAQKRIFNLMRKASRGKDPTAHMRKRIIELDIKKCFDRISHKAIMDRVKAPKNIKDAIFKSLKIGVFPEFPEQGTPQGGIFSPLLANIALDGIEEVHTCIRYADDMLFFLKEKDNAEKVLGKIKNFLAERGMEISEEKTKITLPTDGVNFLGWRFSVKKNGKFLCTPSEENYVAFRKKVKAIVLNSNIGAVEKVKLLKPIIRGWKNYHQYCDMSSSRDRLWFLNESTYKRFMKEKNMNSERATELVRKAFCTGETSYSINGFVNVQGIRSPYDGDIAYWSERNSKLYFGLTVDLLKKQDHKCGVCGSKFYNDEDIHLHHIDGNHDNWDKKNLTVIHNSCHQYIHMAES
ncbi:MAG: reverse transcriptase domain-containing protein [Cyanobacteria bacterium J06635_10]